MHHRSPTFARTPAVCVVDVASSAFYDTNGLYQDLREVLEEGRVAYLLGYCPGDGRLGRQISPRRS